MAEWLILRLPRSPDVNCSWMLADSSGQALSAPESGTLNAAAAHAGGRQVGVLLPAGDALLTEVELPQKSGVRPQQVVAYALEEQLAAEIETLHFALGERRSDNGRTPVAVVTRALMQEWLASLRAVGLSATALCDEATALPDNPGHTLLLIDADTLCIRRAGQAAQSLPADDVAAALKVTLGEALATEHLICYATPQDWQRRGREVEALRPLSASLKVQLLNSGTLPLLAPSVARGEYINLLSEEFAPERVSSGGWQRWRLAAMLAVALFAVHVAGLSLELLQQHRSERALDSAIGDFARSSLPGDSGQGAVRERAQQRLLEAQARGGNTGLMAALAALGQALSARAGTAVEALSYHDGGMDLKLRASDADSLDRVDQVLRSNGWQADLTSGAASGNAYEGRIQMRPPGSGAGRAR